MAYTFVPPTRAFNYVPNGMDGWGLWSRLNYLQIGYLIIRDAGGAYTQVVDGDDDVMSTSTAIYRGGSTYVVTTEVRDELVAAGYGAYVTGTP